MATIHERYPDQDWLYVFTDGSATASFGRAGAGAFSNSFNLKEPLVPDQTILIILMPQLRPRVSGYNLFPSKLEFECKQFINSFLCTGREVVLQWIPSHCGIHENEQADKLAKEASTLHTPCLPMPLRNAKRFLRDKLRQKRISTLTDLAVGKPWSCLLDGQRRARLSALSRVEVPMTGEHLSDCPALLRVPSQDNCGVLLPAGTSALYWTARRLMSERTLSGVN
ncbi:uncharacterized protein LOC103524116 [Trichonephila clavipes]|nr:uncharacterized protein LOC103524116 [Trichonephila clavipes]